MLFTTYCCYYVGTSFILNMAETIKILLRPIQNKWTRELFPSFYLNVTNNSIMIFNNDYEAGKVQNYSLRLTFSTFYLNKISLQTLRFCLAKNHRRETGFLYSDLRGKTYWNSWKAATLTRDTRWCQTWNTFLHSFYVGG